VDLEIFITEGLGNASYLVASGDEAVLIDPQRDVDRFLAAAEARRARITAVLETHVHNDYVSGALEARDRTGATVGAPARGGFAFPHRGLSEGDELKVGDLRLVAIETPGHTPEHLAYLVYQVGADEPSAAFTGGSMMVGTAGRTDLLGLDLAEDLARAQYRNVRRLADLPPSTEILPTHGGGSFCAASRPGGRRTSTVQAERASNAALLAGDEDAFVRAHARGSLAYPAYYRHMASINRAGPRVLGRLPRPPALTPDDFARAMEGGAWAIDGRPRDDFAREHIRGALNIERNEQFASYVGWLIPFGAPLLLVVTHPDEVTEAVRDLSRIGYEDVRGFLEGGVEAWRASGRPVGSYEVVGVDDLCERLRGGPPVRVLDVRQEAERSRQSLPGSIEVFVGDLPERLDDIPRDREVWAICASGHRSAMAASMLDGEGIPTRLVGTGGVRDLLARCGDLSSV
jgi:hydroxyacylglutathione hydrolase